MEQPAPTYEGEEPYVFVSYSHRDEKIVFEEIRGLQELGVKVWYDARILAGSEWSDALANAISGCARFLYFITPSSVATENCRRELNHAIEEGRSILAVHLRETKVPGGIRLILNNRQAILKHQLLPEAYRAALIEALSVEHADPEPSVTPVASSSKYYLQLASGVALAMFIAVAALWLWPRISVETSAVGVDSGTAAPLTAIAVLPFDDLSPEADHSWLVNGIADELIESLSRISSLHVPARRSTTLIAQSGADLPSIGEILDVGTVIEGSVRRVDDQLNVVARWVRIDDGSRLWSAGYDRQAEDILAIQKEITVGIAEAIRTELGIQDGIADLLAQRYATTDVRAWELLNRAIPLLESLEPNKVAEAREMLLLAAEYDPEFVPVQEQIAFMEYLEDFDRGVKRYAAILAQNPLNETALAALAYDSATRYWDYETALQFLQRMPESRKRSESLQIDLLVYSNTGQLDDALRAAKMAVRLDPMNGRANCGLHMQLFHTTKDWTSALAAVERANVAREGQFFGRCTRTLPKIYLNLGRESEIASLFQADVFRPNTEALLSGWQSGRWREFNLVLADITEHKGNGCHAQALAAAGARDRMYQCLESEMNEYGVAAPARDVFDQTERNLLAQNIRWVSSFDLYRDELRFQALTRRLDELMTAAAGTYPIEVDLDFAP